MEGGREGGSVKGEESLFIDLFRIVSFLFSFGSCPEAGMQGGKEGGKEGGREGES